MTAHDDIAPQDAVREAEKALRCLYICVEPSVVDEVTAKVEAAIAAVRRAAIAECVAVVEGMIPIGPTLDAITAGRCLALADALAALNTLTRDPQ